MTTLARTPTSVWTTPASLCTPTGPVAVARLPLQHTTSKLEDACVCSLFLCALLSRCFSLRTSVYPVRSSREVPYNTRGLSLDENAGVCAWRFPLSSPSNATQKLSIPHPLPSANYATCSSLRRTVRVHIKASDTHSQRILPARFVACSLGRGRCWRCGKY